MAEDQYSRVRDEPEGEQRVQVWQMFDRIAPTYDLVNRLLSFNLDVRWRREVHGHLPPGDALRLLDLATGTGDQVIAMTRAGRITDAVGMDMSAGMLEVGRQKVAAAGLSDVIAMEEGDATALPYEDASFDAITISFGIRNVVHVDRALSEMRRILRPGGRAVILEFSLPKNPIVRAGHLFYLRYILPLVGGLVSGDRSAYRYLNTTIEAFPYGDAFTAKMRAAGFEQADAHPVTFGIATIYVGTASR
ncbi:MAG: demethylmenaquinone methyltransferase/2-methoxy-6-polyprenyl-1,4-benzoquinol methylase [Myxococcota bacterium]|jgi:demethylmenaquinone methyltransferase/2-methoxy-6-polyprenyl-1,4-benzoquinol methylase